MSDILFSRVLLLEDDPAHTMLIRRSLKGFTEDCAAVGSVQEAHAFLKESPLPELLIADLNLPDAKGVDHIGEITARYPHLPVVVLTSSNSVSDAVAALKIGAKDFIVKDFSGDFRGLIGVALSRVRSTLALERERRKYQESMTLLEAAIAFSNDGFAIAEENGNIRYHNGAFERFVRLAGGDTSNLLTALSARVHRASQITDDVRKALQELPEASVWHTVVERGGESEGAYDLSLSMVGMVPGTEPARDSTTPAQRVGVVWVRDISESRRRDRFQRDMLATTTHDLKGPLGSILISAEMIEELVRGQGRAEDLILRVAASARGATQLIDEFLSVRRIKEGNFILRPKPQKILPLFEGVIEDYRPTALARKVELQIAEPDEFIEASLDGVGFQRVFGNLLSNALKFTYAPGSVKVGLSETEDEIDLVVSDTGSGMESSEVHRIFDRFSRLEKHADTAGTGLGLFVVRTIVDAHGGRIEVTSHPNKGTTFRVSFPKNPPVNDRGELIALDFA